MLVFSKNKNKKQTQAFPGTKKKTEGREGERGRKRGIGGRGEEGGERKEEGRRIKSRNRPTGDLDTGGILSRF